MKKCLLIFLSLSCLSIMTHPNRGEASQTKKASNYCDTHTCMSRDEIRKIIPDILIDEQQREALNTYLDDFSLYTTGEKNHGDKVPISGILYTHGFNAGLLLDSDEWIFNAALMDHPQAKSSIQIKKMYSVFLENGGLRAEWGQKWIFVFIPSEIDPRSLDGAVFGGFVNWGEDQSRGVSFSHSELVPDFELSLISRESSTKRTDLIMAISLRKHMTGGGISFPRMTFHKRNDLQASESH